MSSGKGYTSEPLVAGPKGWLGCSAPGCHWNIPYVTGRDDWGEAEEQWLQHVISSHPEAVIG